MQVEMVTSNAPITVKAPSEEEKKTQRRELIIATSKTALKELAAASLSTGLACSFATTPLTVEMMLTSLTIVVSINTVLRGYSTYKTYKVFLVRHLPEISWDRQEKESDAAFMKKAENWVCSLNFGILDATTRDTIFHESGHVFTALFLYEGPKPVVTLTSPFPFNVSALTKWLTHTLSPIGESMGSENSSLVVAAAGPALAMSTSITNIALSQKLKRSHPQISRYLSMMAAASVANHAIYALSALWAAPTNTSHDFVRLWAAGLHPAAAAATIIAIPLCVKGAFVCYDYYYDKQPVISTGERSWFSSMFHRPQKAMVKMIRDQSDYSEVNSLCDTV